MERNGKTEPAKGFTLIELLVVIAIIALLLSVIAPALRKAKDQARLMICGSNQRQLVYGLVGYTNDNSGKLPPSASYAGAGNFHRPTELNWISNTPQKINNVNYNYTGKFLGSYLPDVKVFNCPLSPIKDSDPWPPTGSGYGIAGTYGQFYLDGGYSPLHSTYMLLWSYQGYNFDVSVAVNKSYNHFEGPSSMSSNTKLVVQDSLFYIAGTNLLWTNPQNSWYACHPFKGAEKAGPYYTRPGTLTEKPPDVWQNAGYLDGHVVRFRSSDARRVNNWNADAWLAPMNK